MGAPRRPEGADLLRRMEAWGDEWRAAAGSTQPADRPRAEAAVRSLYDARLPVPSVVWVPSPAAGVLAYAFLSLHFRGIRSPWARGDTGNGANRDFNGLAEPFGMEPAWVNRLVGQVVERIPPERRPAEPVPGPGTWRMRREPLVVASEALGFGGTPRVMALVRAAVTGAGLPRTSDQRPEAWQPVPAVAEAAAAVFGDDWDRLVSLLGPDTAGGVFATAVRRVAADLLEDRGRHRNALQAMQPGQWDVVAPVLAANRDVFGGHLWRHLAGRADHEAQVAARLELARSAGPWWALRGIAIISERPLVLRRDDRGRPHSADGPAIAWSDGLEVHAWHGVSVEPWVITDPDRITTEAIDLERNAEVRRVLVERFGPERLVREGGARLVHEDETGRLWRRDVDRIQRAASPWWRPTEEPVVMVEVRNATPEPDGSRKTYYLRVPPTMTTAREAVAWTFGLGTVDYRPAAET
jgi:hypothetical protein